MAQPLVQVDAFTAEPFRGNPAAVCVTPEACDPVWMQQVAREMNLSETAFLHRHGDAFDLRWFTPAVEVDLCGHATIASAHVLWTDGYAPEGEKLTFHTRSGVLTAERDGDWIVLDFPAKRVDATEPPEGLLEALGVEATYVGRNDADYLVELPSEAAVREARPDMGRLAEVQARGTIVTAHSETRPYDIVSRFFAPRVGVPEDPVTGSAHVALGPYWEGKLGRSDMLAFQASVRGGVVRVGVRGDRVLLGGQAVTVLRGELLV